MISDLTTFDLGEKMLKETGQCLCLQLGIFFSLVIQGECDQFWFRVPTPTYLFRIGNYLICHHYQNNVLLTLVPKNAQGMPEL